MTITEFGMLVYWLLAVALMADLVQIPPEYMYSDYENPTVVAWNWFFLPIDVAFAVCGLWARYGNLNSERAGKLALIGATLMFCAGMMALSFWIITLDFDPLWWGMNLWLVVVAAVAISSLMTAIAQKVQ